MRPAIALRSGLLVAATAIVLAALPAIRAMAPATTYDLPAERKIPWRGVVGVEGGIPTRSTKVDCTAAPYRAHADGLDTAGAIQACINGIAAGQVAYLPAGTYTCASTINLRANKTLRGAGMQSTILSFSNPSLNEDVSIYSGYTNYPDAPIDIASGFTKGSSQLVLANASSLSAGNFVYITELNDATIPVDNREEYGTPQTYVGIYGANGTRARLQVAKVTAVSGNTITIDPPMYFTFSKANAPKVNKTPTYIQYAGIEDLSIVNAGTAETGYRRNIHLQGAANCWVRNVRVEKLGRRGIGLDFDNYRNEIRECYLTGALNRADSDQAYGVEINAGSANLVENNIFEQLASAAVMLVSASGNVIGYNYSYGSHRTANMNSWFWNDNWTHGAHNSYNLWEGNEIQGLMFDIIHGSASHNVAFRNRILSKDLSLTYDSTVQIIAAITTSKNNNYMSYIGNVLGISGWNTTYEIRNPGDGWTSKPIFSTGAFGGSDTQYTTMLRHMNFDYYTNSARRCDQAGEPGCQGGSADTTLPASLYLAAKPAWWGNQPWPAIGPDVNPVNGMIPAKLRFILAPPSDLRFVKH
jgi:hypothetical protein